MNGWTLFRTELMYNKNMNDNKFTMQNLLSMRFDDTLNEVVKTYYIDGVIVRVVGNEVVSAEEPNY